jgi:hypothetical protein
MRANVLESKKYPEAIFASDRIDGTLSVPGSLNLKVHGTFTIHGVAHEMTMDVTDIGRRRSFPGDDGLRHSVRRVGMKLKGEQDGANDDQGVRFVTEALAPRARRII